MPFELAGELYYQVQHSEKKEVHMICGKTELRKKCRQFLHDH